MKHLEAPPQPHIYDLLWHAEKEHWWFNARRRIVNSLFWKNYSTPAHPKILSIGTSTGVELDYLAPFGDVTGIDVDPEIIAYAQRRGLTVLNQDITRCTLPDASYDVIFAMDILEHVPDHEAAYRTICRLLKPGGYVVVTVPACPFLWSAIDEEGSFPHQRRYTKKTLLDLLQVSGMVVRKVSYYNFFFFPLAYATRKLDTSPAAQLAIPARLINNVMGAIFAAERHLLKLMNLPIGVSLITIVQKQ